MMRQPCLGYNRVVIGVWGRRAVAALFVSSCFLLLAGAPARADESYAVGPNPVIKVILDSGRLLVQTWDGSQVMVGTGGTLDVQHLDASQTGGRVPSQIPIPAQSVAGPQGAIAVPREIFVLPQLPGTQHDVLLVRGQGDTTITVPRGTALVMVHVRSGNVTIANYNGVFVTHVRDGDVYLQHVSGTGFAQSLRGP